MANNKSLVDDVIAESMYRDGKSLQDIANVFGVSRECVRKRLKRIGLLATDGGVHVRCRNEALKKEAAKLERANAHSLKCYGCSYDELKDIPAEAKRAWLTQKNNAKSRGIGWHISFLSWWSLWQKSGVWEKRGRTADNYNMTRKDFEKPFTEDNVEIITHVTTSTNILRHLRDKYEGANND